MAQKKKAHTAARSAGAVGKKPAKKAAAAAAKKSRRSLPKSKPPARKAVAKALVSAKGKKLSTKTAGTAASVKSAGKARAAVAPKAPVRGTSSAAAKFLAAKSAARQGNVGAVRAVAAAVKPAGQKITAPVAPATPKSVAEKAAAARHLANAQKKPVNQRHGFRANEFIVYPAHGVGRIVGIEEQEIAGMALELFVINFDKEKLTLRVPTGKLQSVGMRKLSDEAVVKKAMETLKGRARVKRTMWSRRAQEYVAKINSGDLGSIAEVVRDLYRSEAQPEQSYSERQLYEDALDRMAREIAAVEKLDERGAVQRITEVLSKSARGRRLAAEAENGDGETKAA
jgi:CarD family transcriptional regulator